MNTNKVAFDTALADLGFSLPTIARLKSESIECLGDFVNREEKITADVFAPKAVTSVKGQSIESIKMTGNLRTLIKHQGYKTHGDVLSKSFRDVLQVGNEGWKVYLVVNLIDLGYTSQDGPLLNQDAFAEALRHMKLYRIILKMDERGQLSRKFKLWFNEVIEGRVYNTDNRPTRKFKIVPFKID